MVHSSKGGLVRFGRVGIVVAAALGAASWACGTADPGATSTLQPTVADGYATVGRRVHPLARPELDRGPLDPAKPMVNLSMVFKLSPEQLADREALKAAQLEPGSPSYHRWLTPEQYAARFGAKPADIERARTWLASQGLEVHEASPLGTRVTFSGSVASVQSALRAPMRRYEVAGEMHYAMSAPPRVPAELADAVLDVTNTHDFFPRPSSPSTSRTPDYTTGAKTGFSPIDWANVYDVARAYSPGIGGRAIDGTGVTIAVVGLASIAQSDIDAWRTRFSLPSSAVTQTLVPNTGSAQAGSGGSGFQGVLDVEWAGGIAKGALLDYVFNGANDGNVDDATYYAIDNNLAPVISTSWGGCDGTYLQSGMTAGDQNVIDVFGSAANVLGITLVAAAGDSGATGCIDTGLPGLYVGTPAAFPGVTAVGGTQFPTGSLTGSPYFTAYSAQETTWNEAHVGTGTPNIAAGGGGISVLFSRPSYQSGVPTCAMVGSFPISGVTAANMRQVPDVAFTSGSVSNPLFMECTVDSATQDCSATGGNPTMNPAGGTSFAAPAFAGVVALMEQLAGGRLGNINPMLYTVSAAAPTAFHDITTGNNEISCASPADPGCGGGNLYGYAATAGYDCATGLGSLDAYNFLSAMASMAPTATALAAAPTTTTEGTPVTLTATVTVSPPNTSVLGGLVTFAFQSYDALGNIELSWTLGTGTITGGTTATGVAVLSAAIPPGLVKPGMQTVDVVAMYGGDAKHLSSTSSKVVISFGPLNLALAPVTTTVAPAAAFQYTSSGGVTPVKWYVVSDGTCSGSSCSTLNEATGAFVAGPLPGSVVVKVIDADGAEAIGNVTVAVSDGGTSDGGATDSGMTDSGTTDGGAHDSGTAADSGSPTGDSGSTIDSGSTLDSGAQSGDSSASADSASATDATEEGGGGAGPSGSSGGCGCVTAGTEGGVSGFGAIPLLGLGLLVVARRRRRSDSERLTLAPPLV